MKKERIILISIIVILIIAVAVLSGYIIYDKLEEQDISAGAIKENEDVGNYKNVDANTVKELQLYLNNSKVSYLLEKQEETANDIKKFLNEYDNQEKLNLIVNELKDNGDEISKADILKKSNEIFGMDIDLEFENIICTAADADTHYLCNDDPVLYIYDKTKEVFYYNDNHQGNLDWEFEMFNKVINAEKYDKYYNVYVNTMYQIQGPGGDSRCFFNNMQRDTIVKDFVDGSEELTIYSDLHSMYSNHGKENPEYIEKLVEFLFTDDILDQLNTYKFKIEETNGTYRIVGFEKVNK